jgi:hypothetical protein
MGELLFAPASKEQEVDGWSPFHRLESSVLAPVMYPEEHRLPMKFAMVPVWGITPGSAEQYSQFLGNSYIIFYTGGGDYPYAAKVHSTESDRQDIAMNLWPRYCDYVENDDLPSYLIYLERVWKIDPAINEIRHWRGNPKSDVVNGFTHVPRNRRQRIENNQNLRVREWIEKNSTEIVSLCITIEDIKQARIDYNNEIRSILSRHNLSVDDVPQRIREQIQERFEDLK